MSFVSEYKLGRDESTTYFLASLACPLGELLHYGRSLYSQTGGTQAGCAYHRHGHRLFHGLAPYYLFHVPHLPSAYCKTSVVQPGQAHLRIVLAPHVYAGFSYPTPAAWEETCHAAYSCYPHRRALRQRACASVPAPCCTNARHRVLAMCVMALGAGLCGAACREE
jgi:hypothetical protein